MNKVSVPEIMVVRPGSIAYVKIKDVYINLNEVKYFDLKETVRAVYVIMRDNIEKIINLESQEEINDVKELLNVMAIQIIEPYRGE